MSRVSVTVDPQPEPTPEVDPAPVVAKKKPAATKATVTTDSGDAAQEVENV